MSIEEIVRAWKADEEMPEANIPNPVGEELSDEALQEVVGGQGCQISCWQGGTSYTYSVPV